MKPGRMVLPVKSITCAPGGTAISPLRPTALNRPASMTMMELSIGARPVPSISRPPCSTSAVSNILLFQRWVRALFVFRHEDRLHLVDDRLRRAVHLGKQRVHRRAVDRIDCQ